MMTLPEVAEYLNGYYTTVLRLVHRGAISAFRLGGSRCRRADIEQWIAQSSGRAATVKSRVDGLERQENEAARGAAGAEEGEEAVEKKPTRRRAQGAQRIRETANMLSVSVDVENLDPEVRPVLEWIEACRQEGKEIDYLEGARWFEGDGRLVHTLLKACIRALDQALRFKLEASQ
jgi:excisionase family DNA binding protein